MRFELHSCLVFGKISILVVKFWEMLVIRVLINMLSRLELNPLPKSRDLNVVNKYRGISLSTITSHITYITR